MTYRFAGIATLGVAAMIGLGGVFISEGALRLESNSLVATAEARIGRPLTPMSYAGVARRTTRRAVVAGAAVAAPYYAVPGCYQTVDAYGRVYEQCP